MNADELRQEAIDVLGLVLRGQWPSDDQMRIVWAMKEYLVLGPINTEYLAACYANQASVKGE